MICEGDFYDMQVVNITLGRVGGVFHFVLLFFSIVCPRGTYHFGVVFEVTVCIIAFDCISFDSQSEISTEITANEIFAENGNVNGGASIFMCHLYRLFLEAAFVVGLTYGNGRLVKKVDSAEVVERNRDVVEVIVIYGYAVLRRHCVGKAL